MIEQGNENERFTESSSEVARAEGVDAILRTIESLGRIVISSDDEEALLRQITVSNSSGPSMSKARSTKRAGSSMWVSRVLRGKRRGSRVNSDKIRGHGKEISTKQNIVINML